MESVNLLSILSFFVLKLEYKLYKTQTLSGSKPQTFQPTLAVRLY